MAITINLAFEISNEAYELLKIVNKEGAIEYRDPEFQTAEEFKTKNPYYDPNKLTGYNSLQWYLDRNTGGTIKQAIELDYFNLIKDVDMAWYQTFEITEKGKEVLKQLETQGNVEQLVCSLVCKTGPLG